MRKIPIFLGLLSVTGLTGAVASCSSTTTTTTNATEDGGGAGDGSTKKDSGSSTSSSGSSGDPEEDSGSSSSSGGPDDECFKETTLQACGQCCATNHQKGYLTFQNTLLDCACKGTGAADAGNGGPCATDCASTACKTPPAQPAGACNTCLQNSINTNGACADTVVDKCTADSDCLAYQKDCLVKCPTK